MYRDASIHLSEPMRCQMGERLCLRAHTIRVRPRLLCTESLTFDGRMSSVPSTAIPCHLPSPPRRLTNHVTPSTGSSSFARLHPYQYHLTQHIRARSNSPAIANGAPKPTAVSLVSQCPSISHPPLAIILSLLVRTHETPIPHSKEPRQRIERDVASRALGVVVWRAELRAGGVEAAAGSNVRGAEGRSGEHLACVSWELGEFAVGCG